MMIIKFLWRIKIWNSEGHDLSPIKCVIQYDTYHRSLLPELKHYPVVNYKLHVQKLLKSRNTYSPY